jgi:hypothetical protein
MSSDHSHLRSYQWRVQLGILSSNPGEWASQLSAQRAAYAQWVVDFPFPGVYSNVIETATAEEEEPLAVAGSDLDPLTAMWIEDRKQTDRLQELDLQYRKEKALRKRGYTAGERAIEDEHLSETEQQVLSVQIIDKDLHRLPDPDELNGTSVTTIFRKEILRQVLFLFSCNHPHPGYQQGMHEIASYVLYALELDGCPMDHTARADTYHLLACLVTQLLSAYDAVAPSASTDTASAVVSSSTSTPKKQSSASPLEQMSVRILHLVQRHDPVLFQTITALQVPPQLFFTKWIRLLFSREVTDVLGLWDQLFAVCPLSKAAEALAAARLLVHRNLLLEQQDLLHFIMNLPMEEESSIPSLVSVMKSLLGGEAVPILPTRAAPPTSAVWSDPLSQALQSITMTNPTTPTRGHQEPQSTGGVGFSLSGVKERLASQTQSISKRLYHEWGTMAAATAPVVLERNYDDPPPPSRGVAVERQQQTPRTTQPSVTLTPQQLALQMNAAIGTLQTFAMQVEREQKGVPNDVWEAIANLEVIRQNVMIMKHS